MIQDRRVQKRKQKRKVHRKEKAKRVLQLVNRAMQHQPLKLLQEKLHLVKARLGKQLPIKAILLQEFPQKGQTLKRNLLKSVCQPQTKG